MCFDFNMMIFNKKFKYFEHELFCDIDFENCYLIHENRNMIIKPIPGVFSKFIKQEKQRLNYDI
jgi:hypothetical protein